MKWTDAAEAALKKAPFFVRKKVRARVEDQVCAAGRQLVSLADVKTAQARFLAKMSEDVKGYQIDSCFAAAGCPNRVVQSDGLLECIEKLMAKDRSYRVQLGGKLGRHPRLARELPGRYSETQVLEIIKYGINFYRHNSIKGERFAELFAPSDFDALVTTLHKEGTRHGK